MDSVVDLVGVGVGVGVGVTHDVTHSDNVDTCADLLMPPIVATGLAIDGDRHIEVNTGMRGIRGVTGIESGTNKCHLEVKMQSVSVKCDQLDAQNQLLRKDVKRKHHLIRLLVQKLRSNVTSTQRTLDMIEKQLLNDQMVDQMTTSTDHHLDAEAILPQDFLDFEMNQELISEPSMDSPESESSELGVDRDNTGEEWSPKKSGHRLMTKDGKYGCKWLGCGKLFSRNANLTRHYNTHVRNRCHVCPSNGCGKHFTDQSSLKRHRRQHTGHKPYKCTWSGCEAQFGQASILAYHRKSHTGERNVKIETKQSSLQSNHCPNEPFVCDVIGCQKTFDNVTNLRRHQAIHNGTRLYYCDWQGCDKNFLELSGLKRHRRIHTGERPYKCDWPGCGAKYSQSSHLSTHIKSHKNQRDYKCSLPDCTFAGVRMSDLRKHLRRKHKWQQSDFDDLDGQDTKDSINTTNNTSINTTFNNAIVCSD